MRKSTEENKTESKERIKSFAESLKAETLFKEMMKDLVTHSNISTALQNVLGASSRFKEGKTSLCLSHLRIAKQECEDAIKAVRRTIYEEKTRKKMRGIRFKSKYAAKKKRNVKRVVKKKTKFEL